MPQSHSHSHLWPGVPLALGSAALFGATPPLCKLLLDTVNPFMLAGLALAPACADAPPAPHYPDLHHRHGHGRA